MSGSVNAQIPLSFQPTPNVGPNFGKAISDANNLVQLQQFKQQVERANKLRDILGAPDAIDAATGTPKTETISKAMSVDPAFGMKLGENAVTMQTERLRQNSLRSKASADQATLLNDTFSPIVLQYEEALKPDSKVPKQQAEAAAQKAWTEAREGLVKGGAVGPDVAQNIPTQWNYQDAKRRAMASDVYLTNLKNQRDQAKEGQTEKHQTTQEQIERERIASSERAGRWVSGFGNDTEGRSVPGMYFTPKDGGEPVFHPGVIEAPKGGAKSAANQDRDAITNVVRSDYEKELGRPVNLADPNEKAELDKRVLDAEDKRKVAQVGGQTAARIGAQQAEAKPIEITVDGQRQQGIWKDRKWYNTDGTPVTGKVALAGKQALGSVGAERATRFEELKAEQQKNGTYTDDTGVYKVLDRNMAEDRQTAISDEAATIAAQIALKTGHPPVWMGRSQASMTKFLDTYAKEAKAQGLGADDIAANQLKYAGELAESRTLGTMSARVDFGAKELDVALPQAMETSQKVWRPGFKKIAELQQAIKGQVSDPDLLEFAQFNQQVISAYAQMMGRGGLSTVHAMDRAEGLLSTATSQAGYMRQLDTLHKEVQTILYGTSAAKDHLRSEITGKAVETPSPTLTGVPRTHGQGAISPELQEGIDILKQRPETAGTFEKHFNLPAGSAQQYLKAAPAAPAAAPPTPAPAATPAPAQPATPPSRAGAPVQGTAAAPLPLPKTEADLVDGGIYASDKGVVRFDKVKKRFFPVGGQ